MDFYCEKMTVFFHLYFVQVLRIRYCTLAYSYKSIYIFIIVFKKIFIGMDYTVSIQKLKYCLKHENLSNNLS